MCPPTGPTPAAPVLPAPRRADGLVLLGVLQGSGHQQAPGLVRRADGQTVQVTGLLHALLECVDGQAGPQELARRLSDRIDRDVAAEDVAWLLEHRLRPLGLLQDADGAAPQREKAHPLLALRLKKVVTDPAVTDRITAPFAPLFAAWLVVPVLVAFAATCWFVLVEKGLASAARAALYEPGLLLAVVGLTVLSAGFHELGHAAACRYGGARPGAMGVGVYLVWPAFYTDVDDSYRLSKWGRLRVDLGGLYFNCLVAVGVMAAWLVWREDALLLGVAAQLLQMLRQLAPFVRADGYHILADLTGVPDLFAHIGPTLRRLVPSRRAHRPSVPLKPWARAVVTVWVLVVVPVLLALLVLAVVLLPRLAATAWDSAGLHAGQLAAGARALDPVLVGARLLTLLALVLPVAGTVYLLVRVVRSAWRAGWRASEGSPRLRAGLVLTAVTAAALTGYAWVPDQQRTPLQASERGSVADALPDVLPDVLPQVLAAPAVPVAAPARPAAVVVAAGPPSALGAPRVVPQPRQPVARPATLEPVALPTAAPARAVLAPQPGRQFPFALPAPPGEQDVQALAVGRRDGGTVHEVSYGLVQLVDPATVTAANEAYALASCTRCTTTAVAFQVVLVVGHAPVVVPLNAAVAANDACLRCVTTAVAVQLVATLTGVPGPQVEAELRRVLAGLAPLRSRQAAELGASGLYAAVKAVEAQVLGVLLRNGLVRPQDVQSSTTRDGATTAAATGATTAAQPAPVVSPSPSPTAGPTAVPSASPTPLPTPAAAPTVALLPSPPPSALPTATPTASPGPGAEPTTSPTGTPSPSPEPSPAPEPSPVPSGALLATHATPAPDADPSPSASPEPAAPSTDGTPSPVGPLPDAPRSPEATPSP